ncbi:MAG: hypothetical protein ACK4NP_12975 [Parvularculaceae bacterium]
MIVTPLKVMVALKPVEARVGRVRRPVPVEINPVHGSTDARKRDGSGSGAAKPADVKSVFRCVSKKLMMFAFAATIMSADANKPAATLFM